MTVVYNLKIFKIILILFLISISCSQKNNQDYKEQKALKKEKELIFISEYSADTILQNKVDGYNLFSFQVEEYINKSRKPFFVEGYIQDIQKDSINYIIYFTDILNNYRLKANKEIINKIIDLKNLKPNSGCQLIIEIQDVSKIGYTIQPVYDNEIEVQFSDGFMFIGKCLDVQKLNDF